LHPYPLIYLFRAVFLFAMGHEKGLHLVKRQFSDVLLIGRGDHDAKVRKRKEGLSDLRAGRKCGFHRPWTLRKRPKSQRSGGPHRRRRAVVLTSCPGNRFFLRYSDKERCFVWKHAACLAAGWFLR